MDKRKAKEDKKGSYKTLSIPEEMYTMIESLIEEHPELGYKTVTEFVKEAIRSKIHEIERIKRFIKIAEEMA
jgi:Arc/MetJ-type ribon-helix-helix transcriptional regulator